MCIKTYSTFQRDTFKWLLLVHHQLLLLKCEPSQERVKFYYVNTSVNKCRSRIILTAIILHEGPHIVSESSGFKCIQLISQVFAELPFLNDNFQMNYSTIEGILASQQVKYRLFTSFQKITQSQLNLEFGVLASCKQRSHQRK